MNSEFTGLSAGAIDENLVCAVIPSSERAGAISIWIWLSITCNAYASLPRIAQNEFVPACLPACAYSLDAHSASNSAPALSTPYLGIPDQIKAFPSAPV